ncbi:uncharacterized protein EAE98_010026 [Botrytis deweyae]|uniref:Uncharacterized protein n=1 Tax=Botrytis deweyae TaxID=2478750 RepID=A0ABQ7IA80_9HELO|nr:uncharacterized protein EAE98_010026 [Botrytis deweyae]KAF7917998.1 hypothetical protein EAE98_010026 [Botrytis deweyae]
MIIATIQHIDNVDSPVLSCPVSPSPLKEQSGDKLSSFFFTSLSLVFKVVLGKQGSSRENDHLSAPPLVTLTKNSGLVGSAQEISSVA